MVFVLPKGNKLLRCMSTDTATCPTSLHCCRYLLFFVKKRCSIILIDFCLVHKPLLIQFYRSNCGLEKKVVVTDGLVIVIRAWSNFHILRQFYIAYCFLGKCMCLMGFILVCIADCSAWMETLHQCLSL